MGVWSYTYDALEQLMSQTDANGQIITMQYDLLGRMTSRTTPSGASAWTYDGTDTYDKIGALKLESGSDGYRKRYQYDSLSRLFMELYRVDDEWYYTETEFDTVSRPTKTHYYWRPKELMGPDHRQEHFWKSYSINYNYDNQSYVTQVTDVNGDDWWTSNAYDANDRIVKYTYGNQIETTNTFDPFTHLLTETRAGTSSSDAGSFNNIQHNSYQ